MCRLLGLIANKPVDLEFSLERFKQYADRNRDGWGIGWYEDNQPHIFKQGISAKDSKSELPALSTHVRSKIIITHLRWGTGGRPSEENSHPFQYKKWLFAHNGSLDRGDALSLLREEYRNEIKGETDSEIYFYWILQNIEDSGEIVNGIKSAVDRIRQNTHSGLNFLLSDGNCLCAFRYSCGSPGCYSLYSLKREPSGPGELEFESEETAALLRSKSLKQEKAVLVCSEKLTRDEGWLDVGFGKLLVIDPDLNIRETGIE